MISVPIIHVLYATQGCLFSWYILLIVVPFMTFLFYFLQWKQAIGSSVVTVGYIMKPSREDDFAKVSPLGRNEGKYC